MIFNLQNKLTKIISDFLLLVFVMQMSLVCVTQTSAVPNECACYVCITMCASQNITVLADTVHKQIN